MVKWSFYVGCIDTPAWENGRGYDCNSYGTAYCENGAAKPGKEWALGKTFKYPENNCCVCGKDYGKHYSKAHYHTSFK